MAGVVTQERIDANSVIACEVLVDDCIRQRDQQTVTALSTFDPRLLANTRQPLIATGRCVASPASGLAFPTDRVDIRAAAKQPTKQRYFFGGGKT